MLEGRLEHFATISDFLRRFPIFSEYFRRLPKISTELFPKFSKEFPNIQQRWHEPLLPVTDRPLNFFMYVINKYIIQLFSFNLKFICTSDFFQKFKFNSPCGLVKFWYFLKNSLIPNCTQSRMIASTNNNSTTTTTTTNNNNKNLNNINYGKLK